MALHYAEPFIITLPSSKYDLDIVEGEIITKTRLFKYIDNFTTKKPESFQIKSLIFSIFLLKT